MRIALVLLGCVAAAALSAVVVAPAPAYDAWAWLLWGREVAGGGLDTAEGPAFKPLPVAVCAVLSLLGGAAPLLWVIVARAGTLLALVLVFHQSRRLTSAVLGTGAPQAATWIAGLLAVVGVALCGSLLGYTAEGMVTGWLLALGLAGVEAWHAGRPRAALACAFGCCLLHVEAWPFAAAFGVFLWLQRPGARQLVAAAAVAVPVLWIVPEWLGSGEPLRSGTRARVPNPGQPALADVPALASLREATQLLLWPLWIGVAGLALVARQRWGALDRGLAGAIALAVLGISWITLVAAMTQFGGFSGEPRYALPGMALIAMAGAVGLVALCVRAGRWATGLALALMVAATAVAALPRLDELSRLPEAQGYQWRLATDLADAVQMAGGRSGVMSCGTPYVGPLRGPLMAYRLDVPKQAVEPDVPPRPPGMVFRSRRTASLRAEPAVSRGFGEIARTERWQVLSSCEVRLP